MLPTDICFPCRRLRFNAVLDLGSGNHVTLVGVAAAALAEDHFLISAPIA